MTQDAIDLAGLPYSLRVPARGVLLSVVWQKLKLLCPLAAQIRSVPRRDHWHAFRAATKTQNRNLLEDSLVSLQNASDGDFDCRCSKHHLAAGE